jgi:hypothetical protein
LSTMTSATTLKAFLPCPYHHTALTMNSCHCIDDVTHH